MKFLKGLIKFILSVLIIVLTCALFLSLASKNILNNVASTAMTEVIVEELSDYNKEDEIKKEILENKQVQEFINKYGENIVNDILEDNQSEVTLDKDIITLLDENIELLNKYGIEITKEDINKLKSSEDYKKINDQYKEIIRTTKTTIPSEGKGVYKALRFLISLKFKILCILGIIVSLIIIALLDKSLYKWIKTFGITLIISGVFVLFMFLLIYVFINLMDLPFKVDTSILSKSGLIIFIVGIIITIVYSIIYKRLVGDDEE